MAWRWRSISEMTGDLVGALRELALPDGGGALFREVAVFKGQNYEQAAPALALLERPSALVLPGPGEVEKDGARNKREVAFLVFVAGEFSGQTAEGLASIHDLLDAVMQGFSPLATAKNTQRVIQDVTWEVEGHEPLESDEAWDAASVVLVAIDFRRER